MIQRRRKNATTTTSIIGKRGNTSKERGSVRQGDRLRWLSNIRPRNNTPPSNKPDKKSIIKKAARPGEFAEKGRADKT